MALAACSGAGTAGTTPAVGAGQTDFAPASIGAVLDAAPEVSGGHEVFRKIAMRPNVKAPALIMNFVANGPAEGGVPCIGCVSGASTSDNIGLSGPSSYVLSNTFWQYALSFTDVSYKGKCKLSWAITSGKKTIDSFSASFNLTSTGGFVLYALNRSRPKYSGNATLTGKYACGSNSASTQEPLFFE